MSTFSPRIAHLFPSRTLAQLLTPTYAAALDVDEEEAHERLSQALRSPGLVADLQRGLARAIQERRGLRTTEDKLLDSLSAGIARRGGRVKAAASTPAVAAVMVRVNLEIGLAPEPMRATLASGRGAAVLEEGLLAIGSQLVKDLLR